MSNRKKLFKKFAKKNNKKSIGGATKLQKQRRAARQKNRVKPKKRRVS